MSSNQYFTILSYILNGKLQPQHFEGYKKCVDEYNNNFNSMSSLVMMNFIKPLYENWLSNPVNPTITQEIVEQMEMAESIFNGDQDRGSQAYKKFLLNYCISLAASSYILNGSKLPQLYTLAFNYYIRAASYIVKMEKELEAMPLLSITLERFEILSQELEQVKNDGDKQISTTLPEFDKLIDLFIGIYKHSSGTILERTMKNRFAFLKN